MKKLDNKGMSLVEVVMAILIISLASLMLVQSLSTVTTVIAKADEHTRSTNNQLTALVGSSVSDDVILTLQSKEALINVEGSSTTIRVSGEYAVASSNNDSKVQLKNFTITTKEEDEMDKMIANANSIYQTTKDMSAAQKNEYITHLEEEKKIDTGIVCNTGAKNDELRAFYYLEHGFSPVKQSIIDECNAIFDSTHANAAANSHEGKAKIGTRPMYIKPYYVKGNVSEFVLYATYTNDLSKDEWKTNLIYSAVDKSWYYKIFPANSEDLQSYLGLTSINVLQDLQAQLYGNGWKKLTAK